MPARSKDRLTKTAYLRYLECPQEFWLSVHQPLFVTQPYSLEYEHLRQQGYAVQQLAKRLERFRSLHGMIVDFERSFQSSDLYTRSDVVVVDPTTGILDIYEVKAAASVKDEYYDDVAFQRLAAERAGFNVGRCYVITMNGEYVRRGEIDVDDILAVTDVTERVEALMAQTEEQVKGAFAYLKTVPVASLVDYCVANKINCEFIKLHFPNLPDYTVFDIAFLKHDKRRDLLSQGVIAITDVPASYPLSEKQRLQVEAARSGRVVIDHAAITKRIESWEYPLHFLDYETFSYAIPQFDGIKPFQQMCFQYSLHTIDEPGAEPRHSHFLSHGDDDPPRALAENLMKDIGDRIGSVFVWYESFEKTRNSEMAAMFPEHAGFFEHMNERTVDLMKIFSDNLYIHPEFKGRTSIKKVLPVVVPELSYASLGIGDGMTATISWFRAVKWETIDADTRQKVFDDLEKYCELDTIAMVKIFRHLVALAPSRSAVVMNQ